MKHVPNIIKYLGNVPLDRPENAGIFEKLRYYKLINGLYRIGALKSTDAKLMHICPLVY